MAHSPHRRWKGCCPLCAPHKVRGTGRSEKDPAAVRRGLGKSRRLTRRDLGDQD
ncbi:hypothetical protein [Streptomyces sp. NPDC048659]|uniref:hypothetical protein n=1 Tax=Streptomyces sp. NPDC048659 TaxID=3155489 RepID=UPI00341239A2